MCKRKVLFVLPNLNSGGAERVTINYLRQLNLDKYNVTLLVFKKTDDLAGLLPDRVILVDIETDSTSKSLLPLIRVIWNLLPDIVYTTHSRVAVLLMLVKPFVRRFKHIARMQGTPSLDLKHKQYGKFSQWFFALGFNSADVVIAQTDEMKQDARKCFYLPSKKIKVLNNPIDNDYIDANKSKSISLFNSTEISAVASGRLRLEKGFDILIKAVAKVITVYPNFKLHILGDDRGSLKQLKSLIELLKLQNHVFFVGFIKNPYSYYYDSDLFILSSRREGFPNVLLENYYLNTPIVATRCVPIVEQLIVDGSNGYTCAVDDEVDLADKIIKCLSIKRNGISNPLYKGSYLEALFE
jgi:glycosyltransferase involved in cell wall biosynthesis